MGGRGNFFGHIFRSWRVPFLGCLTMEIIHFGQKKMFFFHFWLHVNYTIGMFCSEMYLFLWGARYVNCINEMGKSCLINIIHLWFNFGSNNEFWIKESRAAGLKMVKKNFHNNIAMLYIKIKHFLYWKSWWQFWGNWKKL